MRFRDCSKKNPYIPTSLWLLTKPSPSHLVFFVSLQMSFSKKTVQPRPEGQKGDSRGCNDHLLGGHGLGVRSVLQAPQPLLHGRVSRTSLWNMFLIKWLFHFLRSETLWNPHEFEERKLGQQNVSTLFPYPGKHPERFESLSEVNACAVSAGGRISQGSEERWATEGPGAGHSGCLPQEGDSCYSNTSAHLTRKSSLLAATLSLARSSTFSSSVKSHKIKTRHH